MKLLNLRYHRRAANGFTLVEMIAVLGITALLVSAVMLSSQPSAYDLMKERDRLAVLMNSLRDNAILRSRPMAVKIDEDGYSFELHRETRWQPVDGGVFTARNWGEDIKVQLDGQKFIRLAFDQDGLPGRAAEIVLRKNERTSRVSVDAAGNVKVINASKN